MGELSPQDLYLDLLSDLSQYLPTPIFYSLVDGSKVDSWPGITFKQFAALQMAKSFYKKFVDSIHPDADQRALDKFLNVNKRCGSFVIKISNGKDEVLIGELKRALYEVLYPHCHSCVPSLHEILSHARTGPGSAIGSRGGDFYTKMYSSPLTYTSEALYLAYSRYIGNFPLRSDAERIRSSEIKDPNRVVEGNRITYVKKNADISRLICTEPSLNMYYQLGLEQILLRLLKRSVGIDLSCQQMKNRELARIGSLTGSFATIDLESASDSMSLSVLRQLLPRPWMGLLELLRSPKSTLPDGRQVELNMVSTMGNGFTFPLQTILFSAVVIACFRFRGVKAEKPYTGLGNFGVNGDDIVVPTDAMDAQGVRHDLSSDVVYLLNLIGFVVNDNKSFSKGPFRESCGGDFFEGRPCRGVYVSDLSTCPSRFSVINRINLWSAETGMFLPLTASRLLMSVPYFMVPPWENEDAGVRVPFSMVEGARYCKHTRSVLYRRLVSKPKLLRFTDGKISYPAGARRRIYNPSGLLHAFVGGHVTSGTISVRQDRVNYRRKWGLAPNWDLSPTVPTFAVGAMWQRWNTAVYFNLYR